MCLVERVVGSGDVLKTSNGGVCFFEMDGSGIGTEGCIELMLPLASVDEWERERDET